MWKWQNEIDHDAFNASWHATPRMPFEESRLWQRAESTFARPKVISVYICVRHVSELVRKWPVAGTRFARRSTDGRTAWSAPDRPNGQTCPSLEVAFRFCSQSLYACDTRHTKFPLECLSSKESNTNAHICRKDLYYSCHKSNPELLGYTRIYIVVVVRKKYHNITRVTTTRTLTLNFVVL